MSILSKLAASYPKLMVLIGAAVMVANPTGRFALAAEAPTPKGELSGIWWNDSGVSALKPVSGPIPLTSAGIEEYKRTADRTREISAGPKSKADVARCAPFGVPRVWTQPFPVQIIHKAGLTLVIFEHNRVFRLIYMNERLPSTDEADPFYLGHSVGRWDGDALIVESTGYNDATVLDDTGLPHSDQLKIVERLRKVDGGKSLELEIEIEDPVYYSKPWIARFKLQARPDAEIEEYICGVGEFDTRLTRAKR